MSQVFICDRCNCKLSGPDMLIKITETIGALSVSVLVKIEQPGPSEAQRHMCANCLVNVANESIQGWLLAHPVMVDIREIVNTTEVKG